MYESVWVRHLRPVARFFFDASVLSTAMPKSNNPGVMKTPEGIVGSYSAAALKTQQGWDEPWLLV